MSIRLVGNMWLCPNFKYIIESSPLYVQISSYQQDINIDEMLVYVFEIMSRESKVTHNEISKVLSENMLDLLL